MPIVTGNGCVRIAKCLKDNLVFWFGIGRVTPWPNDNNPPQESADKVIIDEVQGYRKVTSVMFVREDPDGTIVFKDKRYSVVEEENIYTQGARWLYFSAWLMFDQFPVVTFRQTGLFVDVVPVPGSEGKEILLPNEVQSSRMIAYVNHQPRVRVKWGKDLIEFVLDIRYVLTSL